MTSPGSCPKAFSLQPSDFTTKHHVLPPLRVLEHHKKSANILELKQNPRQRMALPPQHRGDTAPCVAACTRWGLELFGVPLPRWVRWQDLALLLLLPPMVPPLGLRGRVYRGGKCRGDEDWGIYHPHKALCPPRTYKCCPDRSECPCPGAGFEPNNTFSWQQVSQPTWF